MFLSLPSPAHTCSEGSRETLCAFGGVLGKSDLLGCAEGLQRVAGKGISAQTCFGNEDFGFTSKLILEWGWRRLWQKSNRSVS